MKFFPPGSNRKVNVNVARFIIDWNREVSKPQKLVKDFLYPYWRSHVVLEEMTIPCTRWRIDLMNLTRHIVIEVSPHQHQQFVPFFHQNRFQFGAAMMRDIKKADWAKDNGFQFVEIFDEDLDHLSPKWFLEEYQIVL